MARNISLLAGIAALVGLLLLPALALADEPGVAGGCTVVGTSTSGGTVDLAGTGVWHLQSDDHISVTATAPTSQDEVVVNAVVLGYPVPVVTASSGDGSGGTREFEVADFAQFGRVFLVEGSSAGSGSACTGQIQIIIDDLSPLTTALGIGAAAVSVVGLATLLLAIRQPGRFGRRLTALIGFGLAVAGASVLIGQFSDGVPDVGSTAFVASVPGPLTVNTDVAVLAAGAVATALLVLVLPFPAELFNKTVEEHLDEIRGWLARLPLVGGLARGDGSAGENPLTVGGFVALSAVLYGFLDPGFGADLRGLVTWGGMAAALLVAAWTAAAPRRAFQQVANQDRGRLRAVVGTLGVALACVLISRVTGFLPGYLYGLIFGYRFLREFTGAEEGRAVHAGAWWMLGVAAVAWLLLDAARVPGVGDSIPGALMSTVLAALVVGGIEGIVFALVPMRFLHGAALFSWSRVRWSVLYGIGLFGFLMIVLNPANGFVATANPAALPTAIGLFIGFGILSFGTWAFFRFRTPPPSV